MGVARRLQAATMKCTLVFALAIIAFANAGSSNPEDNTQEQACATLSGATAPDMWTSGVGSSTCTAAASESSIWYKGVCDNAAGTYAINAYSDDTCATAATGTFTAAAATLPASVTYATSASASACTSASSWVCLAHKHEASQHEWCHHQIAPLRRDFASAFMHTQWQQVMQQVENIGLVACVFTLGESVCCAHSVCSRAAQYSSARMHRFSMR